jgi:hypothetical protein
MTHLMRSVLALLSIALCGTAARTCGEWNGDFSRASFTCHVHERTDRLGRRYTRLDGITQVFVQWNSPYGRRVRIETTQSETDPGNSDTTVVEFLPAPLIGVRVGIEIPGDRLPGIFYSGSNSFDLAGNLHNQVQQALARQRLTPSPQTRWALSCRDGLPENCTDRSGLYEIIDNKLHIPPATRGGGSPQGHITQEFSLIIDENLRGTLVASWESWIGEWIGVNGERRRDAHTRFIHRRASTSITRRNMECVVGLPGAFSL